MQGLDLFDSGPFDLSDWDQRLPPPAAKTAVQTLTVVVVSAEQADKGLKCPVCLLEFEEQETVREMPCKHLFHSGCILPWLGKVRLNKSVTSLPVRRLREELQLLLLLFAPADELLSALPPRVTDGQPGVRRVQERQGESLTLAAFRTPSVPR